jgi:hypothetical protein
MISLLPDTNFHSLLSSIFMGRGCNPLYTNSELESSIKIRILTEAVSSRAWEHLRVAGIH